MIEETMTRDEALAVLRDLSASMTYTLWAAVALVVLLCLILGLGGRDDPNRACCRCGRCRKRSASVARLKRASRVRS